MTVKTLLTPARGRILTLAALAIGAFADNSLLTRAALADGAMDAGAFASRILLAGVALTIVSANRSG